MLWYKKAAEKLNDDSVNKWANRTDYFKGVDEVMKRIYPKLSDDKRTVKARETFFDSVCDYVRKHPEVRNNDIINYFNSLKNNYRIALITTNIKSALERILLSAGLTDFFDIIEASMPDEKDDKRAVFERFIKKYGKPLVYIGGNRKDSFDYCRENGINCIFANLEKQQDIEGVESAYNLEELNQMLSRILTKTP
ncbi:HAD hydrolase-like protein [Candidatus Pacearchaeota archaeon]|nr:HAD hydrolase-like protein [Candidatus Pacearchaeota archaeon]